MGTDDYTPDEEGMKFVFVTSAIESSSYWDALDEEEAAARWDRFVARIRAEAWDECAVMAASHGAFNGQRTRWLKSLSPYRKDEE